LTTDAQWIAHPPLTMTRVESRGGSSEMRPRIGIGRESR